MTKEEFMAGAGETPVERAKRLTRKEWEDYTVSDEGAEEIFTLIDRGEWDGPTGDA